MLRGGGFTDIAAGGTVSALTYVTLRGGEPPGEDETLAFKDTTPDAQADYALKRLAGVAAKFADPATPYRSLVHPMWSARYGDYDHLARVKEWSLGSDGGEP